jgi:hypothetical protein
MLTLDGIRRGGKQTVRLVCVTLFSIKSQAEHDAMWLSLPPPTSPLRRSHSIGNAMQRPCDEKCRCRMHGGASTGAWTPEGWCHF